MYIYIYIYTHTHVYVSVNWAKINTNKGQTHQQYQFEQGLAYNHPGYDHLHVVVPINDPCACLRPLSGGRSNDDMGQQQQNLDPMVE